MKAEIIAVGTEILLGQIVNTNAKYMAQELADLGVDVYFQSVVGDNLMRLQETLHIASQRSDLIVCCGGLGPTEDDLTKDAIAKFTHSRLIIEPDAEHKILELFRKKSTPLVASVIRQAHIIDGSHVLKNDVGLAVGFLYQKNQTYYAVLPGPPREMKHMFDYQLRPLLDKILGKRTKLYSRYFKFGNIGESALEDKINDLISKQTTVSLATYAKAGEITVRATTKANDEHEAKILLSPTLNAIRQRLSAYLYSEDGESLEKAISHQTIRQFGILEVNTNATLTQSILAEDINHNVQLSMVKTMTEPMTQQLATACFSTFVKDNQLANAIGIFTDASSHISSASTPASAKTFQIALCINQKISTTEHTVTTDAHTSQIRLAKLAMFLFLKARTLKA